MIDGALDGSRITRFAEFDKLGAFVENVPDDLADPVSDRPDCLDIPEADDQALEQSLQVAAVGPGGSLSSLTQ